MICYDMKKLFFCHFLTYEVQNGFRMALRVRMYWILHLNRCWYAGGQFVTYLNWITETSVWSSFSLSTVSDWRHVICLGSKSPHIALLAPGYHNVDRFSLKRMLMSFPLTWASMRCGLEIRPGVRGCSPFPSLSGGYSYLARLYHWHSSYFG